MSYKKKNTNNFVSVSLRLPKKEVEKIKHLIEDDRYLNVSDFCRTAVRNEIMKNENTISNI